MMFDRQKLINRYVHHRNLLLKGYQDNAVLNAVITNSILIWLFLRDFFSLSRRMIWIVPVIMATILLGLYIYGLIWEKKRIFQADYDWHQTRQPISMKIMELVEKKKDEDPTL